jgi:MFS family permease
VLAGLTLAGVVQVWHVITIATLLGIVNAFDIPARQAFVVDMVGREDLMNAIALNSSLFNGARMIGPAVAGVLVAAIGEGWCFFANSASYIAVIAGLLMMRVEFRSRSASSGNGNAIEGFRFVVRNPPVRALMLLLGIVSLTGMPYAVLMPIFADQVLHSGAQGMGILMGCSGIGALAGALTLASKKGIAGLGRWVAYGATGFGIFLIIFGLSRHFLVSSVILVGVGFWSILQMATSNTLIQSMAPDELRGRVMAVYSMMFMGMAPMGALGAGVAASAFGAPLAIIVGGLICLCGAGVFGWRLRFLRPQARELILAQQTEGGVPSQEITGERAA